MIPRMTSWLSAIPLVAVGLAACAEHAPLDPDFLVDPSAPTILTATATSYSQIDLAWQDNARNEGGWELHRSMTGPAGAFSLRSGIPPNATTASDYGLQGNTEYCYKVRSLRLTGRRTTYGAFSNVACATTPPIPVPASPSGLSTTPRCCYMIDVTWTDNSSDETGFRVQRGPSGSGPWSLIATPNANGTFLTDYASPEQTFCYRIAAVNSVGGESSYSNTDCTAIPATPTDVAGVVSGDAVNLTWMDTSSLEDGFQVERSGAGAPPGVIATLAANTSSYRDATVVANNTYTYAVRATRDGGTSASSEHFQVIVATSPPNPAANVQVHPQSSTGIWVMWSDASTNEQGFRVQRSTNGGGSWTTAVTVESNHQSAPDYGLTPEAPACYRVIAFNNVGDAPPSNTDCTTPPAGPTGLTASGVDAETVDLGWTDNSGSEDGFEVWAVDCTYYYYCYYYSIAILGPNVTAYRHRDPSAYWYSYVLAARKDGGYSDLSAFAFPTAPPSGSPASRAKP